MGNPYKKYICQNAWADLRGPSMCMLKVRFGQLKMTVTPILFISTIHYSSFSMDKKKKKKHSRRNEKLKENRASETEEEMKERLRI